MVDLAEKSLQCVVVTPETTVLDATASFVAFPGYDGEIGVLPGRAPLVARLGPGELRLVSGPTTKTFFVDGGFAQVHANVVTILTPRALPEDQLDGAALQAQLDEINAETSTTPEAHSDKSRRLARVRAQLHMTRK